VATGDLDDKPTNDRESELEDVKSRLQHELALQGDLKREIRDLSHKLEISNLDARKRERETTEANATIQKLRVAQSRLQHEVDDLNREKDTVERAKRQVQTKLERLVSDNRALEQDKQNLRLKIAASEGLCRFAMNNFCNSLLCPTCLFGRHSAVRCFHLFCACIPRRPVFTL
jgi:chromosome segregation ATPase